MQIKSTSCHGTWMHRVLKYSGFRCLFRCWSNFFIACCLLLSPSFLVRFLQGMILVRQRQTRGTIVRSKHADNSTASSSGSMAALQAQTSLNLSNKHLDSNEAPSAVPKLCCSADCRVHVQQKIKIKINRKNSKKSNSKMDSKKKPLQHANKSADLMGRCDQPLHSA